MKKKIIVTLLIIIFLTPILSFFTYPKYYVGSASRMHYWEAKISWGIYPFVFLYYGKGYGYPCDVMQGQSCDMVLKSKFFSTALYDFFNNSRGSGGNDFLPLFNKENFFDYYLNIIISFIISYFIASVLVFVLACCLYI